MAVFLTEHDEGVFTKHDDEGLLHCDDGPAVIRGEGYKEYYTHGKLHRLDGPAIEFTIRGKMLNNSSWYIDGRRVSQMTFHLRVIMFLFDCSYETAQIVQQTLLKYC